MSTDPVRLRRYTTAAALFVAGICNTLAFAVWPWGRDDTTEAFVHAVTGSSSAGELGPLLLHYGFVALAAGILGLLEMLRPGPAAWGQIAGVLAFAGVVSFLPSAQIYWFLRSADAAEVPAAQLAAIAADYPSGLAYAAIDRPAVFVTLVAWPLLLLALWRSGVLPWWPAVAMFTGLGIPVFLPYSVVFPPLAATVQAVALLYIGLQVLNAGSSPRRALKPGTLNPRARGRARRNRPQTHPGTA